MPGSDLFSLALRDLADDALYHGANLAQGALDLVCLLALGAAFYAASLDGNAALDAKSLASAQTGANAIEQSSSAITGPLPVACASVTDTATPFAEGCISAQVIAANFGT